MKTQLNLKVGSALLAAGGRGDLYRDSWGQELEKSPRVRDRKAEKVDAVGDKTDG